MQKNYYKNYYNGSEFLVSAHALQQLPLDCGIEVAFSGRSNAGKSSVLNALTGRSGLARTSKTPGRTQQLNVFVVDVDKRLVDLPGYGYAKVSDRLHQHWLKMVNGYFLGRQALSGLVLIMDVRHPLRDGDLKQLEWSQSVGLPVHIVLNKSDKLSNSVGKRVLDKCVKATASELVSVQLFSCLKKSGAEELRTVLDRWFGYAG